MQTIRLIKVQKIWVAKKATHARSFETYPKEYEERIEQFLSKYL